MTVNRDVIEGEAAARLLQRPESLSLEPILKEIVEHQQKVLNQNYSGNHSATSEYGTYDTICWHPSFEYIKPFLIRPKVDSEHSPAKLILLYSHVHEDRKIFSCHRKYRSDLAKIILCGSVYRSYPDDKNGCIIVQSINASSTSSLRGSSYRYGSFLIQIAVESSFREGYEGRVSLFSTNSSGQFYFKLGFLPETMHPLLLARLESSGEPCDGGSMYLPQSSISAWKKIIKAHPIILTSEEVAQLDIHSEARKKYFLNLRLNALLAHNSFHIDTLFNLLKDGADLNSIPNGYKALHIFVLYGNGREQDENIRSLVQDYHTNMNIKDSNGRTAVHNLVKKYHDASIEFIKYLSDLGAELNTIDNEGQRLLDTAIQTQNYDLIYFLKNIPTQNSNAKLETKPNGPVFSKPAFNTKNKELRYTGEFFSPCNFSPVHQKRSERELVKHHWGLTSCLLG